MAHAEREFTCPDCQQTHRKRAPQGSEQRCWNCAIARSIATMQQIHDRQGPFYVRWLHGQVAAGQRAQRELDRLAAPADAS